MVAEAFRLMEYNWQQYDVDNSRCVCFSQNLPVRMSMSEDHNDVPVTKHSAHKAQAMIWHL